MQRRKTALQTAYEKRLPIDIRDDPEKEDLVDKLFRSLADAQSEQAVDDCDAKFNLHFPPDEAEIVEGGFKRPKRRSHYSICRKAGLGTVAKNFGLAPDCFGENLQATYKVSPMILTRERTHISPMEGTDSPFFFEVSCFVIVEVLLLISLEYV